MFTGILKHMPQDSSWVVWIILFLRINKGWINQKLHKASVLTLFKIFLFFNVSNKNVYHFCSEHMNKIELWEDKTKFVLAKH